MKKYKLKIFKSIIPCLLLTLSIGWCYAFSLFSPEISNALNVSIQKTQFIFCLNIFFLGLGAATFGRLVEKNIKIAALTSTTLLFLGLILSGIGIQLNSLVLVYIGAGILCGISQGIGYVVPVKNLILWWNKSKHKGLVAAISIISFGLGSTLCSYLFKFLFPIFGIGGVFYVLSLIYLVPMLIATFIIDKPKWAKRIQKKNNKIKFDYKNTLLHDNFFKKAWTFMFLNISMGLILIGSCASLLKNYSCLSAGTIIIVMMLCGLFNGAGRLVFPFASDFLVKRINILIIALLMEISVIILGLIFPIFVPISIILINAGYGCFFACLPSILHDHYGEKNLSTLHGLCLSSWGCASIFAYICSSLILAYFSPVTLLIVLAIVYMINLVVVYGVNKNKSVS